MVVEQTPIQDLLVITPRVFADNRGSFYESFNQQRFEEAIGEKITFVQDNESISHKGVLRGLHFQLPPMAQGKLVHVVRGSVLDVAVDLRKNSPHFGQHFTVELSGENKRQLWIPAGFAHGFVSLEQDTIFAYKCTNYYAPETECTLRWNDPDLAISWGTNAPLISEKDADSLLFRNFDSPF